MTYGHKYNAKGVFKAGKVLSYFFPIVNTPAIFPVGGVPGALHASCSNLGIEAITIGGRVCSIGVVVNASWH
ncbi:uncharacterized protein LOC108112433 isoform X4 [Drosophila eugracilis]|nr:uncharacterized protein LOC108112433 isoform X4 [Drosophila eugracilis]